jgi:uncharacterized membrane protein
VVFIPFSTALMADHLKSGADEEVAAFVYTAAFFAMGAAFGVFWTYITRHRQRLGVQLSDEEIRRVSLSFLIGNPFYAVALVVAFISPVAVLIINGAVALYYMVAGMRSPELE